MVHSFCLSLLLLLLLLLLFYMEDIVRWLSLNSFSVLRRCPARWNDLGTTGSQSTQALLPYICPYFRGFQVPARHVLWPTALKLVSITNFDVLFLLMGSGAHHPKRTSPTLSLRDNLCQLFLELFPANVCLRCGPNIAEIIAVEENGRRMRDFASRFGRHFFQRWFRSYTDRSGDRKSRETHF